MAELAIKDPWKKGNVTVPRAHLTKAYVAKRAEDSRDDTYALVWRAEDGRQFGLTMSGHDIGELLKAVLQAERPSR